MRVNNFISSSTILNQLKISYRAISFIDSIIARVYAKRSLAVCGKFDWWCRNHYWVDCTWSAARDHESLFLTLARIHIYECYMYIYAATAAMCVLHFIQCAFIRRPVVMRAAVNKLINDDDLHFHTSPHTLVNTAAANGIYMHVSMSLIDFIACLQLCCRTASSFDKCAPWKQLQRKPMSFVQRLISSPDDSRGL